MELLGFDHFWENFVFESFRFFIYIAENLRLEGVDSSIDKVGEALFVGTAGFWFFKEVCDQIALYADDAPGEWIGDAGDYHSGNAMVIFVEIEEVDKVDVCYYVTVNEEKCSRV